MSVKNRQIGVGPLFLLFVSAAVLLACALIAERVGVPLAILRFLLLAIAGGVLLAAPLMRTTLDRAQWSNGAGQLSPVAFGLTAALVFLATLGAVVEWQGLSVMALPFALSAIAIVALIGLAEKRLRRIDAGSLPQLLRLRLDATLSPIAASIVALAVSALGASAFYALTHRALASIGISDTLHTTLGLSLFVLVVVWSGGIRSIVAMAGVSLSILLATAGALIVLFLTVNDVFPALQNGAAPEAAYSAASEAIAVALGLCGLPLIISMLASSERRERVSPPLSLAALLLPLAFVLYLLSALPADPVAASSIARTQFGPLLVASIGLFLSLLAVCAFVHAFARGLIDDIVLRLRRGRPLADGRRLTILRFTVLAAVLAITAMHRLGLDIQPVAMIQLMVLLSSCALLPTLLLTLYLRRFGRSGALLTLLVGSGFIGIGTLVPTLLQQLLGTELVASAWSLVAITGFVLTMVLGLASAVLRPSRHLPALIAYDEMTVREARTERPATSWFARRRTKPAAARPKSKAAAGSGNGKEKAAGAKPKRSMFNLLTGLGR